MSKRLNSKRNNRSRKVHYDPQLNQDTPLLADPYRTVAVPFPAQSYPSPYDRPKQKLPNRTTKTSHKLALFPDETPVPQNEGIFPDEVYNQIGQISHETSRFETERLSKLERAKLPRVTAYCTASQYRMSDLMRFLQSKRTVNGTAPKRLDEVIYTPYIFSTPVKPPSVMDMLNLDDFHRTSHNSDGSGADYLEANGEISAPELFFFDYGVVVMWGMTEWQEQRILGELGSFGLEDEKLAEEDVETEEFRFYYNANDQPKIYNDVITLRHPNNYMVKLTISHAIAQSTKMTLFEGLIEETIESTKHIPQTMAESGKVHMSHTAITKKIGQLFIMRINVNLVSNILDTPEIFWSEPALEPLYQALRGYLEISQRVELLNQRVAVISDLLDMLKEHLTSSHGEQLEWIVIILIVFEIVIGVITIAMDSANYAKK
ncbi:uncharacterized protein VTP21DRAFT_1425 [Calcarisporiella thermophila]|uniref:uncharacterized protein n=1 Tax=Calcarisporiella thermophila TaxID=911321 RepID=UPI003742976B